MEALFKATPYICEELGTCYALRAHISRLWGRQQRISDSKHADHDGPTDHNDPTDHGDQPERVADARSHESDLRFDGRKDIRFGKRDCGQPH